MTWTSWLRGSMLAIVTLAATACGSTGSSATDCPSYVVSPDAGVAGFSSIGEWRTDSVCARYCTSDYPVCQLVNQTTVKCQKGCA
jgi:hypothetical protein